MATSNPPIPSTPRVISPSPEPSQSGSDDYFPPVTRSATRQPSSNAPPPIPEDESSSESDLDRRRARSRSRSRDAALRRRRFSGLIAKDPNSQKTDDIPPVPPLSASRVTPTVTKRRLPGSLPNGQVNGHLSPTSAVKNYWRELSRSTSPLGLIPIHREWRSFLSCSLPK